jgi:hypothetical protein
MLEIKQNNNSLNKKRGRDILSLKSEFKPTCKKIWKAFNSWRKRGMWFRVTVLLLIIFSMNIGRLYTTNHAPLISEFVWIACRAIRSASEPRVTSAHLRYLHAKKSRLLQYKLRTQYDVGNLRLNTNELKLLNQNTLDANYNKLFALAKRAKIIPADVTLAQTKRAMLDKALKLTAERYDHEWADVKKRVFAKPPLTMKGLKQNLWWFCHSLISILPLPIIPVLPWFILCLSLGFWGAMSKSRTKFLIAAFLAVIMTSTWLYFSAYKNEHWFGWFANYQGRLIGISVFFSIWALIGSILGKRLYKYALKYSKDTKVFIFLLLISCAFLLMPKTFFKAYYIGNYYWWIAWSGNYLLFKMSSFTLYFATIGVGVLFYTLFFVFKTYAEQLGKYKWTIYVKYLVIVLLLAKLAFLWYPF